MSIRSSEKIEEANRAIGASVDQLENVFQMQYSDTFSMVRDTYADFRKHLMPASAAVVQAEQIAEKNADKKVEQLRSEIKAELSNIVSKVGQTDAQLSSVKTQLEGVVDEAIARSRKVDKEAVTETAKAAVTSYISRIPFGEKRTVDDVVETVHIYSPTEVCKILFALSKTGSIKFEKKVKDWRELGPFDQFGSSL